MQNWREALAVHRSKFLVNTVFEILKTKNVLELINLYMSEAPKIS